MSPDVGSVPSMTGDRLSAVLSVAAAFVVVAATWFQWWDITMDGGMRARPWVKVMLVGVMLMLATALVLLFVG